MTKKRVLLLLPTTTYRATDFIEAAKRLRVEVTVASETANVLASKNPAGYLTLDCANIDKALKQVKEFSATNPLDAILGADDQTMILAAYLAKKLGLKGNPPQSVMISRNKRLLRECLSRNKVPTPNYRVFSVSENPKHIAAKIVYPCVLKPTTLAASQGVIRADNEGEFIAVWQRILKIIWDQKIEQFILVESFIPGQEVALEGIVQNGKLRPLALFDKPDPLNGPYFEETIYVTPSRLPLKIQEDIFTCAAKAVEALGLQMGPVHAELRINDEGPWIIEVAARPIGGKCSRALRFNSSISLEELILRQALGMDIDSLKVDVTPSGVMMIPIPKSGVYRGVSGLEKAKAIAGIEDIVITAPIGKSLVPLPEGSSYLGFIFARAKTPALVEQSLREAHKILEFVIEEDPAVLTRSA